MGAICTTFQSCSYWEIFAHRLKNCNKLELLENYLPWNNPQLLSKKIYFIMLERYLNKLDYKGFFLRVHHWPVLYVATEMLQRIEKQIFFEQINRTQMVTEYDGKYLRNDTKSENMELSKFRITSKRKSSFRKRNMNKGFIPKYPSEYDVDGILLSEDFCPPQFRHRSKKPCPSQILNFSQLAWVARTCLTTSSNTTSGHFY